MPAPALIPLAIGGAAIAARTGLLARAGAFLSGAGKAAAGAGLGFGVLGFGLEKAGNGFNKIFVGVAVLAVLFIAWQFYRRRK